MKNFLMIVFLCSALSGSAQKSDSAYRASNIRGRIYLETGAGMAFSSYRDFAVSPLIYRGRLFNVPINFSLYTFRHEVNFLFNNSFGRYSIPEDGGQIYSTGYIGSLQFRYLRLINGWSNEKWRYHAGGAYDLTTTLRLNPALFNASTGNEIFGTLFASFKVSRDLSKGKPFRIGAGNFSVDFPRPRIIVTYRLDVSLVNSTLQKDFPYLGQEFLINEFALLDGYVLNLYSGFRIASKLEFTYFLKNKNALSLSYNWDACKTKADIPTFEIAQHTLCFSFLYNFN